MEHVTIDEFVHVLMADESISGFSMYYDNDNKTCHVSIDFGDSVEVTAHDTFPRIAVRKAHALYTRIKGNGLGASYYVGKREQGHGLSVDDVNPLPTGVNAEDVLK